MLLHLYVYKNSGGEGEETEVEDCFHYQADYALLSVIVVTDTCELKLRVRESTSMGFFIALFNVFSKAFGVDVALWKLVMCGVPFDM